MDLLVWLFCESRAALAIVLGLGLFALLVHWRRTLKPRPMLIGLGVAVALWIVQGLVVTQREHAELVMGAIERDLVAAKDAALDRSLSSEFVGGKMDRGQVLEVVRRGLRRITIVSLTPSHLKITKSEERRFEVEIGYFARISFRDFGVQMLRSRWQITFEKPAERWMISRIEPLEVDGTDASWEQITSGF